MAEINYYNHLIRRNYTYIIGVGYIKFAHNLVDFKCFILWQHVATGSHLREWCTHSTTRHFYNGFFFAPGPLSHNCGARLSRWTYSPCVQVCLLSTYLVHLLLTPILWGRRVCVEFRSCPSLFSNVL